MLGQIDTFHGGLNLVGSPWNKDTFHLSQAVSMSNCDITSGGLRGVAGIRSILPVGGAAKSIYWSGLEWVLGEESRSYTRYNDKIVYSDNDSGGIYIQSNDEGDPLAFSEVGVPAPTKDMYDNITIRRSSYYKVSYRSLNDQDEDWLDSELGNMSEAGVTIVRQKMIIASGISLNGFAVGDWICAVSGGDEYWSRIVSINPYDDTGDTLGTEEQVPEGDASFKYVTVSHRMKAGSTFLDTFGYTMTVDQSAYDNVYIIPRGVERVVENGLDILIYPEGGFLPDDWDEKSIPYLSLEGLFSETSESIVEEEDEDIEYERHVAYLSAHGDSPLGVAERYDIVNVYPFDNAQMYSLSFSVKPDQSDYNRSLSYGKFLYAITMIDENGNESAPIVPSEKPYIEYDIDDEDREFYSVPIEFVLGQSYVTYKDRFDNVEYKYTGTAEEVQAQIDRIENSSSLKVIDTVFAPSSFSTTASHVPLSPEEAFDAIGKKPMPYQTAIHLPDSILDVIREGWKVRIYRTNGDGVSMFFLCQLTYDEVVRPRYNGYHWIDGTDDLTLIGNPVLSSGANYRPAWIKPDDEWERAGLKGVTNHYGRFFAFTGKKLFWSAAGNIHAWPTFQWRGFPSDITAILSVNNELLVFGSDFIYRMVGQTQSNFAFERIPTTHGVLSQDLVTLAGKAPMWVNDSGVCAYNGYDVTLISDAFLGTAYDYSKLRFASSYQGRFFAMSDDGDWLMMRMGNVPQITTGRFVGSYSAMTFDPTSRLPVVVRTSGASILYLVFGGEEVPFEYLTGVDDGNAIGVLKHYTKLVIQSDGYVKVTPIIDGSEIDPVECYGGRTSEMLSLPSTGDLRGYGIQFKIEGTGVLRFVRYYAAMGEDG